MRTYNDLANDIEVYAQRCVEFEGLYDHLCTKNSIGSTYLNFRDALTHYIRLRETKNNQEKINQVVSIDEHLHRGLKDACIFTIIEMKKRIYEELKKEYFKNVKYILRCELHYYKNLEIEIRKSTFPKGIENISKFINSLFKKIEDTEDKFIKKNVPFKVNSKFQIPKIK
jgi:hypothetical protein